MCLFLIFLAVMQYNVSIQTIQTIFCTLKWILVLVILFFDDLYYVSNEDIQYIYYYLAITFSHELTLNVAFRKSSLCYVVSIIISTYQLLSVDVIQGI